MRRLARTDLVIVLAFFAMALFGILCAALDFRPGVIASLCLLAGSAVLFLLRVRRALPNLRRRLTRASEAPAQTTPASPPRRTPHQLRATQSAGEAPTLSIVMPVHNVAPYLESALLSVLYQEYQDFELIVIDDASTDASSSIIEMYAALDSRIRVLSLDHNSLGGAGIPSNLGIRIARGKYLGFVDSDDVLARGGFARLIEAAEREHADIVVGGFATFSDDERLVTSAYDLPRIVDVPRGRVISVTDHPTLMEMSPVPWRKLYRMSFIERHGIEYPEGDYFFEDNPLHWAVLSFADSVVVIDDVISHHRMGREGQTMESVDHRKGAFAHHLATAFDTILQAEGERRDVLLAAFVDRVYGSRWVVRQQTHPGAQALLAKRLSILFDRAVAEGARIPMAMRQTVESYRGSYPSQDLTVVIHAFNSGTKVRRTLDSLLTIRGIDCDVLVIDDGSTDNTLSVLRDYESAHGNVHVFTLPHRGAGRSRNTLIPLISGRYSLMLEAGDRVDAEALAACVKEATQQDLDVLFFGTDIAPATAAISLKQQTAIPAEPGGSFTQYTASAQDAVSWNRLVRTAYLHRHNIFFGGSEPYEDILFHWTTIAPAVAIGLSGRTVVERSGFTSKRHDAALVAAHGTALQDTLWFTERRITALGADAELHAQWRAFVTTVLSETRQSVPVAELPGFDERSADLWEYMDADDAAPDSADTSTR